MANSVRPHRQQPTWDSSGKKTGVGCHFLLQCMKVKSDSEVTQSCPTLSNPIVCSLPGIPCSSSVHGILQARVLEWGAIAFSAPDHSYHQLCDLSSCIQVVLVGFFFQLLFWHHCNSCYYHPTEKCKNVLHVGFALGLVFKCTLSHHCPSVISLVVGTKENTLQVPLSVCVHFS